MNKSPKMNSNAMHKQIENASDLTENAKKNKKK